MPYLKQLFPFFLFFFFFFLSSSMDELYPLFFENLSDSIPSVRQGAAVSLSNVVKAYGRYLHLSLVLTSGFSRLYKVLFKKWFGMLFFFWECGEER